ncbi:MAG: hypothetical protein RLZZ450_1589 [Pseudomonadota bacterium]|jgi:hypothetical protein
MLGPTLACLLGVAGAEVARADADACINAHERAQVDRLEGRYLTARDKLLVCAQRECPRLVSTDCTTWLAELDATLPTVVFAVSDDTGRDLLEARVIVNGRLIANHVDGHAQPLDPGVYKVRFEADGYAPDEQTLSVRDGEKSRLARGTLRPLEKTMTAGVRSSSRTRERSADPSKPDSAAGDSRGANDPRARRLRIATYTLGAAAVASFTLALAAGLRGQHMVKECDDADGCSDADRKRGKLLFRTVNVSAIVGGVFLGAATVTLISALRRSASRESVQLSLGAFADAQSASLTAWGRW